MQFSKIASSLLFAMLASSALAAPAPVAAPEDAAVQEYKEEAAPGQDEYPSEPPAGLSKRGFGCPGDRYQCNEHCRSLGGGRKGGYCGGPWWLAHPTCICIF